MVLDARYAALEAIPVRALSAYQRAETVMRSADPSCGITWQLIAAIGKVESNHGRFGGALMTADGVVHPAILGPRLTGHQQTSRITDTDAGLLDRDTTYDRAVGPMQFIPSTWTVVGVDGDNDGRRDPQDIDDASLATGVYLCSGADDLTTTAGQRAAVHRYNHSESYVDLVLQIMAGYLTADPGLTGVLGGPGYGYGLPPGTRPGRRADPDRRADVRGGPDRRPVGYADRDAAADRQAVADGEADADSHGLGDAVRDPDALGHAVRRRRRPAPRRPRLPAPRRPTADRRADRGAHGRSDGYADR